MRLKALISNALLGIAALSLTAQVDPKLKTVTDLSDVYKRAAGLPRLVTVYDFTPPSRGVFEHKSYLTGAGRCSFLASGPSVEKPSISPNVDPAMATLFNPAGLSNSKGPNDLGIVFGVRKYSTATGAGLMRVFMYWWPSATLVTDPNNGSLPMVGIPMHADATTGAMSEVTLASTADSVTSYFSQIDHVRFTAFVDAAGTPVDILSGLTIVPLADADSRLLPATTTTYTMKAPIIGGISSSPTSSSLCFSPSSTVYISGNNFLQTAGTKTSTVQVLFYNSGGTLVATVSPSVAATNTLIQATLPASFTAGSTFTVKVVETLASTTSGSNKVTVVGSPATSNVSPTGNVIGSGPTITSVSPNANVDPTVANTFTITGTNFSTTLANDTITLLNSAGGVVGTYAPSSATSTTLTFTRSAGAISDGTYNFQVSVNSGGVCGALTSNKSPITIKNPVISGSGTRVRVMDLPCPTLIFDSPTSVTDPNVKQSSSINFNGTNIKFDPWSEGHLSAGLIGAGNDVMVGNFFYSPDYLAWVFGGMVIRSTNCVSSQISVSWASAGSVNKGGFAIPGSTLLAAYYPAALGLNSLSLNDGLEGWTNGLPVQTRYQVAKSASITAYLNHYGGMQWVYRFLDGAYNDSTLSEELGRTTTSANATSGSKGSVLGTSGSATDTDPDDPNSSNTATPHLRHLRALAPITGGAPKGDLTYLIDATTSLQVYGPKALPVGTSLQQSNGNEPFGNLDPHTPEPISWALANTYRQILDSAVFGAAQKCARTFVIPFPTRGMNDAQTAALDFGAASAYKSENNGTGYKSYGGVTLANILAGNKEFAPWDISSVAAHDTATSNGGAWKAPWNPDFANTDPTNRIQTMVISLGIPGAFNFTDSHADHQGSHVEYFKIAQFADPGRANWDPSSDSSRLDNCTTNAVFYYPAASPKDVNDALGDALSYIVQASAALSAPATPATGVRNANEAYFGTFQTTSTIDSADRLTLWSGNLYALGLDRVFDATTNTTILEFYGADNLPFSPDLSNTIADYDTHNLWSAYTIFGKYQPNPPITRPAVNTSKLISGKSLLWSGRNMLIMMPSGSGYALQKYDASESSTTQLDAIAKAAGIAAGATPTAADESNAAALMRFILGAYDPTQSKTNANNLIYNRDNGDYTQSGSGANIVKTRSHHVNIMGDIINSAPLAVELTADMVPNSGPGGTSPSSDYATFQNAATYDDPHARLIVVGTNVGQLHCFLELSGKNKSTGFVEAHATELWAFVPNNMLPMLWALYQEYTTGRTIGVDAVTGIDYYHKYGVDGDPALYFVDKATSTSNFGDTRLGSGEDAAVIFGFRKGARQYYQLQVSMDTSNTTDNSGATTPTMLLPTLRWFIDPDTGNYGPATSPVTTDASLIKTMGMSTAVPAFATVLDDSIPVKRIPTVFIAGGYSNTEIDTRFKNVDSTAYANGMGKMILGLNPLRGTKTKFWDFRTNTLFTTGLGTKIGVGAIAGGVVTVPVINQVSGLSQRLYFADYNGNILAINSTDKNTTSGFRIDNAQISTWADAPRVIYHSFDGEVFTTTPDAYRPTGDYPIPVNITVGTSTIPIKPVTVMVTVGSGDRNNPIDADESFTYVDAGGLTHAVAQTPPTFNRLYVIADRQDLSLSSGVDKSTQLQEISPNSATDATSSWPSCYADASHSPFAQFNPDDANYLWTKSLGYFFGFKKTGTLTTAYADTTYDKILVSPLIKEDSVFYSFFSIDGNGGFQCSPNARTSTFRQCDIFKPLYFDPRTSTSKVGDTDVLSKDQDACTAAADTTGQTKACSGLAFFFNSLSSQLVDAGDYVLQGGAIAAGSGGQVASGANTPDIQTVKDTGQNRGFRIRAWRVVR